MDAARHPSSSDRFHDIWGGERTGLPALQIVGWVGIARSKFYDWRKRYGKANEHNAWIPRDHWMEAWERDRIVDFAREFPLEGHRRHTLTPTPPGCGTLRAAFGSLSRGFPAPRLKEFVCIAGLTYFKTSPYYPQSNGKIERWHQLLKAD